MTERVSPTRPKIGVHKFSSCDGCQLAFLNMGEDLLRLSQRVELVHFVEAGLVNEEAEVDVAFIEGSISTPEDIERIRRVRERSKYLITIGACATAGGLQALRNLARENWTSAIYADPQYISSLDDVTPISQNVKVDLELWGCPVNSRQIIAAVDSLLSNAVPLDEADKVCLECKRSHTVCIMVASGVPCMGPVTRTGCGALCPRFERGCYSCYGPAENINSHSLMNRFAGLGLMPDDIARRFISFNSAAPEFLMPGLTQQGKK